jgi:hypothetical protein
MCCCLKLISIGLSIFYRSRERRAVFLLLTTDEMARVIDRQLDR